jgi:hypothetical protein
MVNHGNELAIIHGSEGFEERFGRFFTKDREDKTEEITNEQLRDAERAQINDEINAFFFDGRGGTIDDLAALYREAPEFNGPELQKDTLKVEDLKVESEDPFHIKKYEEEKTVFQRRSAEQRFNTDPLTGAVTRADGSTSNNWVKDDPNRPWGATTTPRSTSSWGTQQTPTSTPPPKPGDRAKLFDQIPRVQQNVMDRAFNTPDWSKEKKPDEGWGKYAKKSWWRKTKDFFKSKKGRVMVKVGLLMAMQLGMAIIGRKYEFGGFGQAAAFLGMMLGTFYISKELQAEGVNIPGGFGI